MPERGAHEQQLRKHAAHAAAAPGDDEGRLIELIGRAEQVVLLERAPDELAPGGRLVVISFHSLEDRLVKRFMRDLARGPKLPKGIPVTAEQEESGFQLIGKASKANEQEITENVRARSAVMRVLERKAN